MVARTDTAKFRLIFNEFNRYAGNDFSELDLMKATLKLIDEIRADEKHDKEIARGLRENLERFMSDRSIEVDSWATCTEFCEDEGLFRDDDVYVPASHWMKLIPRPMLIH